MTTTNLPVAELDFDTVKAELIAYLSTQDEFKDYDFTGSAINTLVDVCAYLVHYVGVQSNFALREAFLESAQLRKNVSAIAKELGYFPSQRKAGRSSFTISLDLTDVFPQPSSVVIQKGTKFVSTLPDGRTLTFVTYGDNPLVPTVNNPEIWAGTVYVAQGTFVQRDWRVNAGEQSFVIDQKGIDTDFLTVRVRSSQNSTQFEVWSYGKNITTVGPNTEAFFMNEVGDGIEIYFGNNAIGKKLLEGMYVNAEFLVTEGDLSNGLRSFTLAQDITWDGNTYDRGDFTLTNITPVTDGSERESIRSIKELAPLSYQRQNRIVTIEDYKTAVLENYPNVKAINAWGGENAVPPEYGKVFVSVAPVYGDTVSPTTKRSIQEDLLNKFSVVGIIPEIVDPEYLQMTLNTKVVFNKDRTTTKASEIVTLVQTAIKKFFDEQVFDYDQSFKYSRFLAAADSAHPAIVSTLAKIEIGKSFTPVSNTVGTYVIKFYNELVPGSIYSYAYTNNGSNQVTLKDSAKGFIDFYINGSLVKAKIGTVDYTNGIITLNGFNPNMQELGPVTLIGEPVSDNVNVAFNNLAKLTTNNVVAIEETR